MFYVVDQTVNNTGKISVLVGRFLSPYLMSRILLSVKMWFCGKSSGFGHQTSNHNSAARHLFWGEVVWNKR